MRAIERKDVQVALAEHKKEIGSLKHRMDEVEKMTESINNLAISVEKLAMSVSTTLERQDTYEGRLKQQGERIGELEKAGAEKWSQIVKSAIAAAATGLVCYVMAKLGM